MKVFDQVFVNQTISNSIFKIYYLKIKNKYEYQVNIWTYLYLYLLWNSNIFKYFVSQIPNSHSLTFSTQFLAGVLLPSILITLLATI